MPGIVARIDIGLSQRTLEMVERARQWAEGSDRVLVDDFDAATRREAVRIARDAPFDGRIPLEVEVVASGLEVPWALAFAPDGRVFVSERAGRIRVLEAGILRPAPWATLPVVRDHAWLR